MKLQTGDVVLIRIQFHQVQRSKIRPALVLLDTGEADFVAAPVTSQYRSCKSDLALADWQASGLNVPSSARLHKLTVLPKSDVVRTLGLCSALDHEAPHAALCSTFCPKLSPKSA
ncbi:MAG: hypothetical protein JNK87_05550 [Bryobacterales bacterium]|nr:hypothetical protein [Bryobacterales bacterium]